MNDDALIKTVTRAAGALALDYFRRGIGGVEAWDKSPGNPVSEADMAVDQLIKTQLMGARPDYGWLSEETADDHARLAKSRVWVVDPIDGTRAFLKGRDGFCVSVALVENGAPVLAALDAPQLGLFFTATKGGGAWLNGECISPSQTTELANCRMLSDADLFSAKFWPERWPAMEISKPNSIALRMALVACGKADAAVALRPKSEWDVAAASLIMAEAGGLWSDHNGLCPPFNQPNPVHATVVAAGPGLYDDVLRRVREGVAAWEKRDE